MVKTVKVSDSKFACIAEAVAHFYEQGFATWDYCEGEDQRVMRRFPTGCSFIEEVLIKQEGLLDVSASRIRIPV